MAEDLLGGLGGLVDGLKGLMPDTNGDGKPDVDLQALLGKAQEAKAGANDDKVDTGSQLQDLIAGLTKFADTNGDGKPEIGSLLEKAQSLLPMLGLGGSSAKPVAGGGGIDEVLKKIL